MKVDGWGESFEWDSVRAIQVQDEQAAAAAATSEDLWRSTPLLAAVDLARRAAAVARGLPSWCSTPVLPERFAGDSGCPPVAETPFAVGQTVQYWSDTHSRWIYGTVRTVHDNGVLDLDEKHGLDPSEVAVRVPDVPGHVQDHQAAWEEREKSRRQTSKWPKAECYCCDLVLPCYRAAKAVPHTSASPEEVSRVIRETKELCADIDAHVSTIQLYGVDYAIEPPGWRPAPVLSPGGGVSPAETLRMWSWAADGASTITGGERSARSEWTESATPGGTPCSAAAPSPRLDEVFAAAVAEDLRSTLSRHPGARTYKRNGLSKTM